jgi:hypothetical protein
VADDERLRIEIGFDGGQILGALVELHAADGLEEALTRGDEGAYPVEADDGRYVIALRRVVYVKRFARETRVGFGAVAGG